MVKELFRTQTLHGKAVVDRFSYTLGGFRVKNERWSGEGELMRDLNVTSICILSNVSLL